MFGITPPEYCTLEENRRRVVPYHYFHTDGGRRYGNVGRECEYLQFEQASADAKQIGHKFITERVIFRNWTHSFNFSFFNPSWDLPSSRKNPISN